MIEEKVQDDYRNLIAQITDYDNEIAECCHQMIQLEKQYPTLNLKKISDTNLFNVCLDDFRDIEEVFSNR